MLNILFVWQFVEMKGDRSKISACKGPFPWKYVWNFDVCQFGEGNPRRNTYTAMKTGSEVYATKILAPADPKSVLSACVAGTFAGADAAAAAEKALPDQWFTAL